MNLDDIKDRALRCEEARDAGAGTVGAYGWAAAAIASAADVPLLLQEIERLREQVRRVESITMNTDGDSLHPNAEIPVSEVQRMLYDFELPFREWGAC